MGPPGGGRNSVTNRYLRHFSVISVTAFDNDTLSTIFSVLVDWWMKKTGFGPNVTKLAKPLVAASLEVYETIQKELLPTPTKSHYTFNLRDVSKVIQVITFAAFARDNILFVPAACAYSCDICLLFIACFYTRLASMENCQAPCPVGHRFSKQGVEAFARIIYSLNACCTLLCLSHLIAVPDMWLP